MFWVLEHIVNTVIFHKQFYYGLYYPTEASTCFFCNKIIVSQIYNQYTCFIVYQNQKNYIKIYIYLKHLIFWSKFVINTHLVGHCQTRIITDYNEPLADKLIPLSAGIIKFTITSHLQCSDKTCANIILYTNLGIIPNYITLWRHKTRITLVF